MPIIEDALKKYESKKFSKSSRENWDIKPVPSSVPVENQRRPWREANKNINNTPIPIININETRAKLEPEIEPKLESNWSQTEAKLESNGSQTRAKLKPSKFIKNETRAKLEPEIEPKLESNWSQTEAKLESSRHFQSIVGLQRSVLTVIYNSCRYAGSKTSSQLAIKNIAYSCKSTVGAVKKAIQRLENNRLIVREKFKEGRGGWTSYSLINSIYQEILNEETGAKLEPNWSHTGVKLEPELGTKLEPSISSSSSLNKLTTTTNGSEYFKIFESTCEKFKLLSKGIDSNDLMKIWRRGVFEKIEDFLLSVEHTAFYLHSPASKSIESPKGWIYTTLKEGFFAAPAGFESWEEKQARLALEAVQQKVNKIKELKKKQFEAEFEIWFSELPKEKKDEILKGTYLEGDPNSYGSKVKFQSIYAKEIGEIDFLDN